MRILQSSKYSLIYLFIFYSLLTAQDRQLVWEDDFSNGSIDLSKWEYETGPTNDNVHYYTSRSENVNIVDSVLNIIALEESYMNYNYTSGLIRTKAYWQNGRMEARIKLPSTNGFVPAFWMLPADNIYGWWPNSGEIDIMEHPTNEVDDIYGSIHTELYNNFSGIGNEGGITIVSDAETEFHLYAIEWDEEQIDYFVDDLLYYTYESDNTGSATWPFNKPFYIILNLAVGGGWVGTPNETTVFPAAMEVDYVRVYQSLDEIGMDGDNFLPYFSSDNSYSLPEFIGLNYNWVVPGNAGIIAGQNTNEIEVDWNYFGGEIEANLSLDAEERTIRFPVKISENLLKNPGFENGAQHWNNHVGYPALTYFDVTNESSYDNSIALTVDVQTLGSNTWDIQLSQKSLHITSGQDYNFSFWAKSNVSGKDINVALINAGFYVYYGELIELTDEWQKFEIYYSATASDEIDINIDLGLETGIFFFDDFILTTPELQAQNQISNGDFFDMNDDWHLTTNSGADANSAVINGELIVEIINAAFNPWDIHIGQKSLHIVSGLEYNVTFDAYAESARTISPLVGLDSDPWTVYSGDHPISLTNEKQSFSFSFIMSHPTDSSARFGFDIGGSDINISFDNIRVSSGESPVTISQDPLRIESYQLFQNYPNPFNPVTNIGYSINEPGHVILKVFEITGREVKTLVDEKQPASNYSISFETSGLASGVYFYTLRIGSFEQSRKMILIR